jgi:PAS domain S-box-containing protein
MIRVLHVDDDGDLLALAKRFLERSGHLAVDTETSPEAALARIEGEELDAVISDYAMPGLTGIDLLRRVRAAGRLLPFVIFTGKGREEIVIQALNEGADFYLQKGGDATAQFAELEHKVRQAVERHQAEAALLASQQALRASEARYRALIENTNGVIFSVDSGGTILYFSPALERLTGLRPGEVIGHNLAEYIYPDDYPWLMENFSRTLEGELSLAEYRVLTRNRGVIWVQSYSNVIGRPPRVAGITGILVDINERKLAEEALRRANHKLQLIASITRHDIRNKLVTVAGYVELLQKGGFAEESSRWLDQVERGCRAIEAELDFMEDYQSLGLREPVWVPVAESASRATVSLDGAPIRIAVPAGLQILVDPSFDRVFQNLFSNALLHGGQVTCIRVDAERREDGLHLFVEDDGCGVPADEKERIFERGYGRNTGMGLFLVRQILGLTDIEVSEHGEAGHGARFEMRVPRTSYRWP